MTLDHISLSDTGLFSQLVLDYVGQREDMQPFSHYSPDKKGLQGRVAELKSLHHDRAVLVEVLREQAGDSISTAQSAHLEALSTGDAFTVCTGHQLNLFTGPLYMMHKVASVFALSKKLSEEEGLQVVPVFWMASEDHDIAEIDHTSVFGKSIKAETDYKGAAGDWPLQGIESALAELAEILGDSEQAHSLMALMRAAYKAETTMAVAMRSIMQSVFGERGLIIIDAADKRLKQLFVPHMIAELRESRIQHAAAKSIEMLEHRGAGAQAHPRDVNLFYMRPGLRARLTYEGERIRAVDSDYSWTREEMEDELEAYPERFSPNVLMRPIYQESILPNIAYVGGPGELSYWLQLAPVYESFDMKMPVLLLRDIVLWTEMRAQKQMEEMGFSLQEMFLDEAILHKRYAVANATEEPDLGQDKEVLIAQFERLIERSQIIDPSVAGFAKGERQRLIKSVETIEKKLVRAEKKKHSDSLARITKLREKMLPGGGLMERKENFSSLYVRYGSGFIDQLLELADPLDTRLKVISL